MFKTLHYKAVVGLMYDSETAARRHMRGPDVLLLAAGKRNP